MRFDKHEHNVMFIFEIIAVCLLYGRLQFVTVFEFIRIVDLEIQ